MISQCKVMYYYYYEIKDLALMVILVLMFFFVINIQGQTVARKIETTQTKLTPTWDEHTVEKRFPRYQNNWFIHHLFPLFSVLSREIFRIFF